VKVKNTALGKYGEMVSRVGKEQRTTERSNNHRLKTTTLLLSWKPEWHAISDDGEEERGDKSFDSNDGRVVSNEAGNEGQYTTNTNNNVIEMMIPFEVA